MRSSSGPRSSGRRRGRERDLISPSRASDTGGSSCESRRVRTTAVPSSLRTTGDEHSLAGSIGGRPVGGRAAEVADEPVGGEAGDLLQLARLLEQVRRAG